MAEVEIAAGRLRGRRAGEVVAFGAVPYATAPRFAPPGPQPDWAGVREAVGPGPAAPQPRRAAAMFTHGELPATDEQCLNLNVFTPGLDDRRPVFVWLHGGGFAIGHAGAGLYSGERLAAAADAVVVTVNYRLGSLGWLGHPDLAAEAGAPAANWGLLDQIAALEWVRDNIAAFGGDADEVTLAGQSAGALSAMDLLVAPAAAGLFRRVALQSPPFGDVAQAPEVAVRWAQALSAAAGGQGAFDPARLRELDAEQIVALHEEVLERAGVPRDPRRRAPDRRCRQPSRVARRCPRREPRGRGAGRPRGSGGHVLLPRAVAAVAAGRSGSPPIVAHLCHTDDPDAVLDSYRERAAASGAPVDPLSLLIEIATDAMIAEPLTRWASARAEVVGDRSAVYRYRVDHPGAGPDLGATHTVEVPLLFGTWRDGGPGERLAGQAGGAGEVAGEIIAAWSRFMHGGGPGWAPVAGPRVRI